MTEFGILKKLNHTLFSVLYTQNNNNKSPESYKSGIKQVLQC